MPDTGVFHVQVANDLYKLHNCAVYFCVYDDQGLREGGGPIQVAGAQRQFSSL